MMAQYPIDFPLRPSMHVDDFLVTASNHEAYIMAENPQEWRSPFLVVYGASGSGKTHLAHVFRQRYQAAEISADKPRAMDEIRISSQEKFLILDNADQIAGAPDREEALFHLYNYLLEKDGKLLLAAQKPAAEWGVQLPDLSSRLLAAAVAEIHPPDDDLMTGLLIKHASDRQIALSDDVVRYLLARIDRSAEAVFDIVARLDQVSLAEKRPVTIPFVRQIVDGAKP